MRKERASGLSRATLDWMRVAPVLVSVVLGGAILVDGAHVCRRIFRAQRDLASVRTIDEVVPPSPKALETQALVRAHLFGTVGERSQGIGISSVAASQKLLLTGTIALSDPARGLAILGDENSSRLYTCGAQLPDGALLREVYPDRVVLQRDGVLEALRFRRLTSGAGPFTAALSPDNAETSASNTTQAANLTRDPREFSQARRWFNGFMARRAPSSDGSFAGFVLHPTLRYKRQYGLNDGDIVTAINGVTLEDPDAAARVLQRATGSSVEITIQRDGAPQQVKLPVGS